MAVAEVEDAGVGVVGAAAGAVAALALRQFARACRPFLIRGAAAAAVAAG